MILAIELSPVQEAKLQQAARRYQMEPKQYLQSLVDEGLKTLPAPTAHVDATAALFARWKAEDSMQDPEEIAQAEAEWAELQANLEANRLSLPIPKV